MKKERTEVTIGTYEVSWYKGVGYSWLGWWVAIVSACFILGAVLATITGV